MGAQSVARFTAAGHGDALATFLEVLEQEAGIAATDASRLRRESRLAKPEHDRVWTSWPRVCGARHVRQSAPWATAWWKLDTPTLRSGLRVQELRQARSGAPPAEANFARPGLPAPGRRGIGGAGYERRSLGITSNLVFSEWERIFAWPPPRRLTGSCPLRHPGV